jgi:uncharacterized protein YjiS (DUF1127 family)
MLCYAQSATARLGDGLARIVQLMRALELALQVRRERRILLGMDDRTLKDMGLNGVAYAEANRPFWDVPADRLRPAARRPGCKGESSTDQCFCR